jgi:hypothetical protein
MSPICWGFAGGSVGHSGLWGVNDRPSGFARNRPKARFTPLEASTNGL